MTLTAAEWLLLGVGLGQLSAAVAYLLWKQRSSGSSRERPQSASERPEADE